MQFLATECYLPLDALHDMEIIHRDVKLDNFMLRNGHVVLGDFGIAALLGADNYNLDGNELGTQDYFAPEILLKGDCYSKKSDVFSLGVTFLKLIYGKIFVEVHGDYVEVYINFKSVKSGFEDHSYVLRDPDNSRFQSLIHKMLAVNPEHRLELCEVENHDYYKYGIPFYFPLSAIYRFQTLSVESPFCDYFEKENIAVNNLCNSKEKRCLESSFQKNQPFKKRKVVMCIPDSPATPSLSKTEESEFEKPKHKPKCVVSLLNQFNALSIDKLKL